MPERIKAVALGIDLGGTKILTAVVSPDGKMISRDHSVTPASKGPKAVIPAILKSAERALGEANITTAEISAIGVGAAGLSNPNTGILHTSPNLPGWHDVPLTEIMEKKLGKKTFLINDANAAALGEYRFGAGRSTRHFIYVTISTGIGGGIIIDNQIYIGSTGVAGEIGHMTIEVNGPPCSCGNRGCWESLASGTALAREARYEIEKGAKTSILEHANGDMKRITAEVIHHAAQQGDLLAKELITQVGYYFGVGLANLINIFNPEVIAIGGGLSNIGDMLLEPAFNEAKTRAFQESYRAVRFTSAELGRNSGVLGSAIYALKQTLK